jgi:hypothetical protein
MIGPGKEVGKMAAQVAEWRTETREGSGLLRLHRCHPPPVQVHAWLHSDHGQDDGFISHSGNQETEQAVDP